MPQFDLPLDLLEQYAPEIPEPAGFAEFWRDTIAEARAAATEPLFEPVDAGFGLLDTVDVTYSGFGGHPIRAWLILPRGVEGPLPGLVTFIGYGGGRGQLAEWTAMSAAGYAHLVMDTRGQGSGHRSGATPDPVGSGPHVSGFMTQGIESPAEHFYRRVFTDAVRALDVLRAHPAVDASRVAVSGGSQGGGIALAVTGILGLLGESESARAAIVDVPFLSHIPHAVRLVDTMPYGEIVQYLHTHRGAEARVFDTLSYFDGTSFAPYAQSPALFSVALRDDICPPSTVYASYNRYAGPREIRVYPFNGHEGGEAFQIGEHVRFLGRELA
ncbi:MULTISPECIES: acetylxylan esterase [unclassified Rathayibacter]|uniref:acetylxylan esterase n=1 Tax=unclassified Rathayibacter TaxID=2609250 RepID=UPI000CE7C569|nr:MULTISPECIES: acetylxylan esterase [unclassified Rathayibacter]PPG48130.1 acetylxylan esterase [Rathayibacter sp. AY2B3]PPI18035.1 acetylxylan esterase [Rathayibacter sp. AY1B6]PPI22872.1 acetylxylan esterase [Rathayibacter sp. AY1B5]PPI27211.1 acetylxylan esterase [Rathayibacter sp. AY1B1]